MARALLAMLVGLILVPLGVGQAPLASDDPAAAIRAGLERWTDDFNARRADHICDLFARDLRYDVQGLPEQDFARLCDRLRRALADPGQSLRYGLHIKEIIISGDLAAVRLTWTSMAAQETHEEQGLDLFARQPDGSWKIIRYIAYPDRP